MSFEAVLKGRTVSSDADPKNPFTEGRFRDDQNPFASPGNPSSSGAPYYGPRRGLVNHLMVIAILNVVQGVLELCMGGLFCFMFVALSLEKNSPNPPPANLQAMFMVFAVIGAVVVGVALLRFFGAYCMFVLRRRNLAIAASFIGLLTVFTFYCSLTSVGVAVYSLVVLFNREVADAFEMVRNGKTARETLDYHRNLPA